MNEGKSLGARIEALIDRLGISQLELAKRIGVDKSVMNRIISGERPVRGNELKNLSKELNVSVDYLLGINVPDWATQDDIIDLEEMLNSNVNMAYGGENLTEEEKQRVKDVLTGIFWEKIKDRKK